MATATQARLVTTARAWLALLPARIDDRRFWIRAAVGLGLRALVLQGTWWPLRQALTSVVARTLAWSGLAAQMVDRATLLVGTSRIEMTVACTHVEVLGLLAPLLWDRSRSLHCNLGALAALGLGLLVLAVLRVDLAMALLAAGVPWLWGHDVLLGVVYFALLGLTLRHGAWMRAPHTAGKPPSSGAA